MVKLAVYLASVGAILAGLWYFHHWSYEQGARACEAKHDKVALAAATDVLATAAATNISDAKLGVDTSTKVENERKAGAKRIERIRSTDLTPGGSHAASSCPDVLGPDFWRLYDGAPAGGGAPAPASSGAAGVPGSG